MRINSYLIWFDWLIVVFFCMQESYITTSVMVVRGSTSFCMEWNCHDCHHTRVSCKENQQLPWLSHGGGIDRMGWQMDEPRQLSHQNDVHTLFFLVVEEKNVHVKNSSVRGLIGSYHIRPGLLPYMPWRHIYIKGLHVHLYGPMKRCSPHIPVSPVCSCMLFLRMG